MMDRTSRARRAFSLVELLVVMTIVAIMASLIAMGGMSNRTADAFAEASRIEESLRVLRSAWLACYAENYYQNMRVPTTKTTYRTTDTTPGAKMLIAQLSNYCDVPLDGDIDRYGGLVVASEPSGVVYIGYADVTKNVPGDQDELRADIRTKLRSSELDLYGGDLQRLSSGSEVLIRLR